MTASCLRWVLLGLAVIVLPVVAEAKKRYWIEDVTIRAEVRPDGAMQVEETRTYRFRGKFKWVKWERTVRRGWEYSDFSVSENGAAFERSEDEAPGTFLVRPEADDEIVVVAFIKARNEERRLTLAYTVRGAIAKGAEVAFLSYPFINESWRKSQGPVEVEVVFPDSAAGGSARIDAFVGGALHAEVASVEAGRVRLAAARIPRRAELEGRIVFPAGWVPEAQPASAAVVREEIIARERGAEAQRAAAIAAAAEWRALQAEWRPKVLWGAIVIGLAVFLGVGARAWRVGRPHQVADLPDVVDKPPTDAPPVAVDFLRMEGNVTPNAQVGTLLDLAERGHLRLEVEGREVKGFFGTRTKRVQRLVRTVPADGEELRRLEADLLQFLEAHGGDVEGVIDLQSFRKWAQRHSGKASRWYREWSEKAKDQCRATYDWWEPRDKGLIGSAILLGLLLVAAGILSSALLKSPHGVPAIVLGLLTGLLGLARRRTAEGRRTYLLWERYRTRLKALGRSEVRASGQEPWGKHLAYGAVLGQLKAVGRAFDREVPAGQRRSVLPWYESAADGSTAEDLDVNQLGAMLEETAAAMTVVMVSAAGSASAGGAGSGGGGSGAG